MFSTTTMESSMTRPIAMASPPDRRQFEVGRDRQVHGDPRRNLLVVPLADHRGARHQQTERRSPAAVQPRSFVVDDLAVLVDVDVFA
jgi:hypothetical protein